MAMCGSLLDINCQKQINNIIMNHGKKDVSDVSAHIKLLEAREI